MAKVYIPGGSTYQNVETPMMTVTEQVQTGTKPAFSFFGIPFGRKAVPTYENVSKEVPAYTPVSAYGVNDTGRTLPFNPNPTQPDYRSVENGKGFGSVSMPGGGQSQQYQSGSSGGFDGLPSSRLGGLLGFLFGRLGGGFGQKEEPYEAALRERPGDIQNLVSMTRNPSFGAPVDPNSAFNRKRG